MSDVILSARHGAVGLITINRPSRFNAMDVATAQDFRKAALAFARPGQAQDTIKIGVLHSLSGTMAISETTLKDTILMLVDEQNKKGGLLGKKIQAFEVQMAMLAVQVFPAVVLVLTGIAIVSPGVGTSALLNHGPHGATELLYAYTSAAGNNGSAFAGLSANTSWYNTTLAFAIVCLSVIWHRNAMPHMHRPFKVPFGGIRIRGFWIGIVPVIGLVQVGAEAMADLVATPKDATTTQRVAELKRLANAFDKKIAPRQQAGAIEKYFKSAAALLRGVIQSTT